MTSEVLALDKFVESPSVGKDERTSHSQENEANCCFSCPALEMG